MATDRVVSLLARDGSKVEFVVTANPPSGQMKYVYFSPKKDYVVAFFSKPLSPVAMERLEYITRQYREEIFSREESEFWKKLFCWPEKIVEWKDENEMKIGIVMPTYSTNFFFNKDVKLKGKEKNGKWFVSVNLFKKLCIEERGDFLKFLRICLNLSRAIRRLHSAGLAHSDLSFSNVLIDPCNGGACVIDVDGLVVPGKFPPDVIGTAGFVAPEVLCDTSKPRKILPSQDTDLHALAVLIYMYLLHRHPLKGGRYFDENVEDENKQLLGLDPLYIEHPTDNRNKNMRREYGDKYDACLPWVDLESYSAENITGALLASLFRRSFVEGLKNPSVRPTALEWETEILKTSDRLLYCSNHALCPGKWFVYKNNSTEIKCPFCNQKYESSVPVLEYYTFDKIKNEYVSENDYMVVFENKGLYIWHINNHYQNNEKIKLCDRQRLAYCCFQKGHWYLVNERLAALYEIQADGSKILKKTSDFILLENGKNILLSDNLDGGRMVKVKILLNH